MTHEESEAVKLTERLVRDARHPAVALIQRGHKIVSQGCNMFRCCRCGEHFDGRGDWSGYCQPKETKGVAPSAEQYFHVDAYRNNRFGEAVGTRVDRMTRYPMVESECRAMVRSLNRSCPPGITYLLTKARDDD